MPWDRKSTSELRHRHKFPYSKVVWSFILFALSLTLVFKIGYNKYASPVINPITWGQLLNRIPFILVFSGVITWIWCLLFIRPEMDKVVMCDKCFKPKNWDGIGDCDCGGKFHSMNNFKWIEK